MPSAGEAPSSVNGNKASAVPSLLRETAERFEQGQLSEPEIFWRDHYAWLKDSGYLLQSRYAPDWVPSWKARNVPRRQCEDGIVPPFSAVADATRISDGSRVLIKKTEPLARDAPIKVFREDQIFRKFSSEPLASDPRNRCVRMIEILPVPDDPKFVLVVMPFYYDWNLVPFVTIGEAVEFISQVVEGLKFMHNNHVWHGDIKLNNILMNASPLLVEDVNPWRPTKTRDLTREARFRKRLEHPVNYYLIDFDLSGEYDPSAGPPVMLTGYGGTHEVPEFKVLDQPCDPLAVDVWCLGNLFKEYFTEGMEVFSWKKKRHFEFMEGLVADMLHENPTQRPSMDEVVRRFSELKARLSGWKLRSRFAPVDERPLSRVFKSTAHWSHQISFIVRRIPAVPTP